MKNRDPEKHAASHWGWEVVQAVKAKNDVAEVQIGQAKIIVTKDVRNRIKSLLGGKVE